MADDMKRKIVDLEKLHAVVVSARAAGKTVVQCHGCFDIVHPGHIRYLEFARRQGDVLIVSLTGDRDITKGDDRPYIPQEMRAENLAALMFVDYVLITGEPTAATVLRHVKPDVYVKGREYENSTAPGFIEERNAVESYGGRIIFSSGEAVFSSTALLEHMPADPVFESQKLKLVCRRHGVTQGALGSVMRRFSNLHVLVVGDLVIDRYVLCDAQGVASESPMMSLIQRDERHYIGGAAIVARHVAAMGAHAFLLTSGADDEQTTHATELLDREGVESHVIQSRPSLIQKTRFLADDAKILKVDRGESAPLDSIDERRAALILEQQAKIADAVIFCDFGYGMITGGLLARVLPTLRHNVPIITADVSGGRANLLNFHHVDLLCPTERELRFMLNDFDSGLSTVAWELLKRTQARHLFVTLEKRGLIVFERGSRDRSAPGWSARLRSEQLPSFAGHVVDRLGCGDALLAAATLALACDADLMATAYLANAAAAIELASLGNHPVPLSGLQSWLERRPELAVESAAVSGPALAPAH